MPRDVFCRLAAGRDAVFCRLTAREDARLVSTTLSSKEKNDLINFTEVRQQQKIKDMIQLIRIPFALKL